MEFKELKLEALRLPSEKKEELAYSLLRSLDEDEEPEPGQIERLWAEEGERRYDEFLEGKIKVSPGEEAIRRIRAGIR